jgi:hypothetical protein
LVSGTVSSAERKHELLAALKGIGHVVAKLETEEESAPRELPPPVTHAEPLIVTTHSPIEQQLLAYFGDPAATEAFSKRAISLTGDLMAHAWALRHLSDRYGDAGSKDEAALSASSRQLLDTMRRDHYRAMSGTTSELINLLGPVLQTIVQPVLEPARRLPLFAGSQVVQRLTLQVLSGAGSPGTNDTDDPAQEARELLVVLRRLQITLEEQP